MPLLIVSYGLQYLDSKDTTLRRPLRLMLMPCAETSLSYSAILNIQHDLVRPLFVPSMTQANSP